MKYFIQVLLLTSLVEGCAAFPGAELGKYTAAANDAQTVSARLLSQQQVLLDERRYSYNSAQYLKGKWTRTFRDECSYSDEEKIRGVRLQKLSALRSYSAYLAMLADPSPAIASAQRVEALASAAADFADVLGSKQANILLVPFRAALKAAEAGDQAVRAVAVRRLVEANLSRVREWSSDLERGLRPVNAALGADLNKWEVCEYEKLKYIQATDTTASLIELEQRYRLFEETRAKLLQGIDKAIETEDVFKSLPALHEAILSATDDPVARTKQLTDVVTKVRATIMAAKDAKL